MPDVSGSLGSLEGKSPAEISAYQDAQLTLALQYLADNSPFYQELFQQHQIDIGSIRTVADLPSIPFTTKDDLQRRNWDFLCVPRNEVAEYCSTSGTLGNPVTVCLTKGDLARLAHNEHLSLQVTGGTSEDIYQLMLTLDRQFMAGIAYYSGIQKAGAGAIRVGPGNIMAQLEAILNLKPTVLIAVPSFVVALIRHAAEKDIDLNKTSVRKIICIGEAIRTQEGLVNQLALEITRHWNVALHSTYASTEKQTAFTECGHGRGNHHQPELIVFEIVDEDGNVLQASQFGELIITTLGVEGMPLLRYKTGDICAYYDEPCACGRNTRRISAISGRKQHQLKLKGTTLFPQAIFNVLNGFKEVEGYVVEAYASEFGTDEVRLHIALAAGTEGIEKAIGQALQSKLRVLPELRLLPLKELHALQNAGNSRKPVSFLDRR